MTPSDAATGPAAEHAPGLDVGPHDVGPGAPDWWRRAVGYEVYLRSFADGSGDGLGDLPGLTARLDHLAWLGVSVVWVTPFYPSPGHDAGYDVADYTDVDPAFGDLDAFDAFVARAHELDLRVVVDIVPNHTCDEHPWFVASRSSRQDPHRDWYHWRDGTPRPGAAAEDPAAQDPPNNWMSVFGGPAWTFDARTGQWYLHKFLPEQPDLNWTTPGVADAFDDILVFWLDRGVDGIRIDVAHGLAKHPELPDLPPASRKMLREVGVTADYAALDHVYDVDQDEVLDVYRRWRTLLAGRGAVSIGEVYLDEADRVARYLRDDDGLNASFWFPIQDARWDADDLRARITDGLRAGTMAGRPGVGIAWALDSHDRERTATRYAKGAAPDAAPDVGRRRSLAVTALVMGLPGVPFLYQGQELGLTNSDVPVDRVRDPIALRHGQPERGRDGARTPMPWEPTPETGMGFTAPGVEPWLPVGDRTPADSVAVQRDDPDSWLQAHRRLIEVRRTAADFVDAPLEWLTDAGPVVAYRRGTFVVAANCGDQVAVVDHGGQEAEVRWASPAGGDDRPQAWVNGRRLVLGPEAAAIVRLG